MSNTIKIKWARVKDQLQNKIWHPVWHHNREQIDSQALEQVSNQIGDGVWRQFGFQVHARIRDQSREKFST